MIGNTRHESSTRTKLAASTVASISTVLSALDVVEWMAISVEEGVAVGAG